MKKLLLFLFVCIPMLVQAYDAEIDGIYYNFIDDEAEVTYVRKYQADYSGSITIPASVTFNGKDYPVTSIGDFAFYNCKDLTSIVIPESVTNIGNAAFEGCRYLTSINIPDGVTTIGWQAFEQCHRLTSIVIPNGVTRIENNTFSLCESMTEVTIPNSVTSIGDDAFDSCGMLTNITIPISVTRIGRAAFSYCRLLKSITIPEGVTSIESSTFEGCLALTDINIPESVTSIEDDAFMNCTSLTSITIPKGVTSIEDYVFFGCSALTSINIPEGVTTIGDRTFMNCSSLTNIKIPDSLTRIKSEAFSYCSSLTSINIPDGVTCIERGAFAGCSDLTDITVVPGNSVYDSRYNCNGIIETSTNTLIAGCQNTIIPDGVTSIEDFTFSNFPLTSISLPQSVTELGWMCFYGCSALTDVYCFASEVPHTYSDVFSKTSIQEGTLYVPEGSIESYRSTDPWSEFKNIFPIKDASQSINSALADATTYTAGYDLSGRRVGVRHTGLLVKEGRKKMIK